MKHTKTNPAHWHPETNLNQDMYFARDIDPFIDAVHDLIVQLKDQGVCLPGELDKVQEMLDSDMEYKDAK